MSDPTDLVVWLNAVLDRREQTAADIESVGLGNLLPAAIIDGTGATIYFTPEADARIVAAFSPDAMRRAIAAKRKILALHDDQHDCGDPRSWEYPHVGCTTVRLLAAEFDHEPGYDERWRP